MLARIKQLSIKACTYNQDGEIAKPEHCMLQFEIPMDTDPQGDAVRDLTYVLNSEFIVLSVVPNRAIANQGKFDFTDKDEEEDETTEQVSQPELEYPDEDEPKLKSPVG